MTNLVSPMLKNLSDYLLLQSSFMPSSGLSNGKMGSVIFFSHYAKYTNNSLFKDFAIERLNEIFEDIKSDTPIDFVNGLCGIGWAINYLAHMRFIDIDDDYLSDLDFLVMTHDPRRIRDNSMDTGMEGVVCYIRSRLATLKIPNHEPFDSMYIRDIETGCQRLGIDINDKSKYEFSSVLFRIIDMEPSGNRGLNWQAGLKMLL